MLLVKLNVPFWKDCVESTDQLLMGSAILVLVSTTNCPVLLPLLFVPVRMTFVPPGPPMVMLLMVGAGGGVVVDARPVTPAKEVPTLRLSMVVTPAPLP